MPCSAPPRIENPNPEFEGRLTVNRLWGILFLSRLETASYLEDLSPSQMHVDEDCLANSKRLEPGEGSLAIERLILNACNVDAKLLHRDAKGCEKCLGHCEE